MKRIIPAVYVYDAKEDIFKIYFNMTLDRIEFNYKFDGPIDHAYACDSKNNIRIEISKRSGDVFHDRQHDRYVVYFYEANREKAIDILAKYLLTKIEIDINYHELQLQKLYDKRQQYVDFKDSTKEDPFNDVSD